MNSKVIGIVFVAALAAASYALASGYGPAPYYDAYGSPPADVQTGSTEQAPSPAPDDASIAKDKQPSALIQAQD